jgi:uncharacterized protein YhfF
VIPANVAEFWESYAETVGGLDETRLYESFYFGDSEELASSLAALVLSGTKRATTGSLWSFEVRNKRPPVPGDLSVVTDWNGTPLSVIETEWVEVVPFDHVTPEFAAAEGEGDGSLAFWRDAHRRYFTRECARAGREFSEDMPVVCERFRLVYPLTVP